MSTVWFKVFFKEDSMNFYVKDEMIFLDTKDGYLLCIGRKEEIDGASDEKFRQMVRFAVAHNAYQSIESSKGKTAH